MDKPVYGIPLYNKDDIASKKLLEVETVFGGIFVIILILLIALTWTEYPNAKYIVLSRTDGESKYIAIQSIDVIDSSGNKKEIIATEGKGQLLSGFANAQSAIAANALTLTGNDILFNGKNMGYFKDTGAAGTGFAIGPIIGALPSSTSTTGYIIFTLGCPAKIARVNIRSADDDISRLNMQRVKVYLLDKDKSIIKGAEQLIPMASAIPQTIHHISFV